MRERPKGKTWCLCGHHKSRHAPTMRISGISCLEQACRCLSFKSASPDPEVEAASKIDHDVAYHATMRRKEAEAERDQAVDQAIKHVESVKIAWHRSDEEKNAAHVKVMAAATEKRQELEADRDKWRGKEIAALDRIEVLEAERDQAQSKADDQHRMVGEIHTELEQARKAADEANRSAANWKRRAESADRGRDEAARRERERVREAAFSEDQRLVAFEALKERFYRSADEHQEEYIFQIVDVCAEVFRVALGDSAEVEG